jgi:hypothetical protein
VREVLKPAGHRLIVVHVPYTLAASLAFIANAIARVRGKAPFIDPVRLRYLFASPRVEAQRFFDHTGWTPSAPIQKQVLDERAVDE